MAEKAIVNRILRWLNAQPHCRAIKVYAGPGYTRAGEPDLDAVWHGRSVKLEVKQPGKQATPLQLATLRRWQAAGAITGVVTSLEEAQELLRGASGICGPQNDGCST